MNKWTKLSIEYANQRSYLDDLFQVYPTIPEGIREINEDIWAEVEKSFKKKDNNLLIRQLLKFNLFPIKDSYIAYLKRDSTAIDRNPRTINRICGRLYEMGLDKIFERCSEPKETNRQIGPMFRDWLKRKSLGVEPVPLEEFLRNDKDAILDAGDNAMMIFAKEHLGYNHNKGLDFVGRFNKQFVIGEAKFLTDFGGHQNAQFNDAISTIQAKGVNAVKIVVLDANLYLSSYSKMFEEYSEAYKNTYTMSVLVLREFLYQL